ncbi:hypothetical protein Patl1_12481 [Pistacia atlantica]|uniref:Uncharacterized protein n=1 Tax=Pistacia atlantica TaxID=434234 RepID=A0ACC1AY18_9ROSI|nr:hypothetical protein Patl1_12481 [Pistacia atlantica]
MALKGAAAPPATYECEHFEGDNRLRTVVATSKQKTRWINPATVKLRHRIGRGPFGETWLATLRGSREDYGEYHEVVVKMLHPVKEDHMRVLLDKLDDLFSKCQGVEGVCCLQGISAMNGKVGEVLLVFLGSVGDKMARHKGGKLSLSNAFSWQFSVRANFYRIGTPNYMAPEQWRPEVRGPISFETDSWGFACSIVEMLTGVQPCGLPPPIENVLLGCFEYDFRSRPLMTDILRVFKSLQNAIHSGGWTGLESIIPAEKSSSGYTEWFLSKDDLQVGDMVRSRKPANSCKPENMDVPEGTVVGLEHCTERDGFVLVRVHGIHDPLKVHISSLERVTFGLAAGDWVRMKEEDKRHSPVGILHSIHRDGNVAVGFIGLETLRNGKSSELQMAESYSIAGGAWATGRICWVLPNGCLVVKFPGRIEEDYFLADPAEVEAVTFSTCPGMVKKYQHLEDHHWVVRPLLIALGLFAAKEMGIFCWKKKGMAGKVSAALPAASEYEQTTMWINPATLKLGHRIGTGPFGETWLAMLRRSMEDYDYYEYHEVAVKMLHPVKEDHMRVLLDKLDDLFSKCQGVEGVCFLQGISVMNGKICLVMKSYGGSVGDKMARLDGGKLSLVNALRYIINLAQGILELHSKQILLLNLKPFNFLLDESDQAVVGDVGIPYILLGITLPSSDLAHRIGTPNYMAPEQWQPEGRGTLSFKTDSWGFACSIVEMLTGVQPWCGKSVDEIYDAVVRKQEKPFIPSGLPITIENFLRDCFEYDFRSRPPMTDILRVFKRTLAIGYCMRLLQLAILQDAVLIGVRTALESIIPAENSGSGYTECFLSKDYLKVGDEVRFRMRANTSTVPDGMVMGLEHSTERNGFALVKLFGIVGHFRVRISSLERVTLDLVARKWVPTEEEDKRHSPVGILRSILRDGNVAVETLWKGDSSELQMAESYSTGQFVRLKGNVLIPRFEWPRKMGGAWATGRIFDVLPSGCLVVKCPGWLPFGSKIFLADPAEVEAVTSIHHWVVKTLLIVSGLFIAKKMGWLSWLPPLVANYLFQRWCYC